MGVLITTGRCPDFVARQKTLIATFCREGGLSPAAVTFPPAHQEFTEAQERFPPSCGFADPILLATPRARVPTDRVRSIENFFSF